jgi:hypothetical protein
MISGRSPSGRATGPSDLSPYGSSRSSVPNAEERVAEIFARMRRDLNRQMRIVCHLIMGGFWYALGAVFAFNGSYGLAAAFAVTGLVTAELMAAACRMRNTF